MSKSAAGPERVAAAQHERDAVAMRLAGATFRQIGEKIGVHESSAAKMVKRVMARTRAVADEDAEELRRVESERLDAMQLAVWPQATKGHLGAVDRVLRIMQRRASLFGLDAPPRAAVDEHGESVPIAFLGMPPRGNES